MTPDEMLTKLYEKVEKTHDTVIAIDTWTKAHTREDDSRHTEMSKRLGGLEQQASATGKMIGLATVLGAFFGFLFGNFAK